MEELKNLNMDLPNPTLEEMIADQTDLEYISELIDVEWHLNTISYRTYFRVFNALFPLSGILPDILAEVAGIPPTIKKSA
jgi:hypothetical protein